MNLSDHPRRIKKFDPFCVKKIFNLTNNNNQKSQKSNLTDIKSYFKRVEAHIGLVLILMFTIIANFSNANASSGNDVANLANQSPDAIADTVASINHYTDNLEVNRKQVIIAISKQADKDFITASNSSFITQLTEEPPPPPTPRTSDITYTISPGDTLSQVAERYNLKTATLEYTNNLDNPDDIELGKTIKIPLNDMSDSAIAAARAKQENNVVAYASSRNSSSRGSGGSSGHFIVPINSNGISQGMYYGHTGIDYMAPVGTPVRAAASGTVVEATSWGWNYGWGKNVYINHGNGRETRYAHLSRVAVDVGEYVTQGEVIGYSGSTGNSTGPHLHFQLDVYGVPTYPY